MPEIKDSFQSHIANTLGNRGFHQNLVTALAALFPSANPEQVNALLLQLPLMSGGHSPFPHLGSIYAGLLQRGWRPLPAMLNGAHAFRPEVGDLSVYLDPKGQVERLEWVVRVHQDGRSFQAPGGDRVETANSSIAFFLRPPAPSGCRPCAEARMVTDAPNGTSQSEGASDAGDPAASRAG